MVERVTIDTILGYLQECVENKVPIGADTWLDGAQKLLALLGNETDQLAELQQDVANIKLEQILSGATAAKSKIVAEASEEFKQAQRQKARIERIQEMIRIAKLQSRMRTEEMRAYG